MILTVTLNPCIDRTLTVFNFREGGTTPVSATRTEIGGKGLNVSRALKNLGAPTLCLGFSHEKGGSDLRSTLDESAIPYDLEEIPGELRMNIKIFDESNRTMSELNDKGCPVSEDAVNRMIDRIVSHFKDAELLVLAGSVPPGVPADIYKILLEKAKDYDLPVILDASGALLLNGIEGKPWLIKPNIDELSATLSREFHSREEIIQAAREIVARGIPYVCVSLGPDGALLIGEKEALYSPAPDVKVRGLQGAGDSLVAGFCLAFHEHHLKGEKRSETPAVQKADDPTFMRTLLRSAQAAAAGSLTKPGTAVWGTVLGCVLLLAVALGVLAALAVSPESVGAQLPMLDLACRLGTAGVVYAVLLFLGMFGTSVSSLVAVLTYAGQKSARLAGHRMALLLVLTAAAFAGSLFGFGDLIGTVYPVYGYLGMAAMLLVAEHAVHARRAGKHCAATGD